MAALRGHVTVVMGVSGSGKSTVCAAAAARLAAAPGISVRRVDADDWHSAYNRQKMAAGVPLDDRDRAAWLYAVNAAVRAALAGGGDADRPVVLLACSALKAAHRQVLRHLAGGQGGAEVFFIYLTGPPALIAARARARERTGDHFMPASLLPSQLQTLEPPGPLEADAATLSLVAADGRPKAPQELAEALVDLDPGLRRILNNRAPTPP
jgi:gluconokinase